MNREFNIALYEIGCCIEDNSKDEVDQVQLPKTINYLNLKQLMVQMGFISELAANSDSNERILLYDMWRILEGDQREEVATDNLRCLIMALSKIMEYRNIGIEPTSE
jgi:UV DNA damage repair endonuclease